eukprot:gb/GECG01012941.1/.p1 GENE.gb/GECG01012941.1/~~gb/GECG01012941.1/.p1  ORF type:complete len:177 (+),score=9.80 gb/GECG01012941.1/:1-531(+)
MKHECGRYLDPLATQYHWKDLNSPENLAISLVLPSVGSPIGLQGTALSAIPAMSTGSQTKTSVYTWPLDSVGDHHAESASSSTVPIIPTTSRHESCDGALSASMIQDGQQPSAAVLPLSSSTSTSASGRKNSRQPVRRACQPCAKAKRRCDPVRPCTRCVEKKIALQCVDRYHRYY